MQNPEWTYQKLFPIIWNPYAKSRNYSPHSTSDKSFSASKSRQAWDSGQSSDSSRNPWIHIAMKGPIIKILIGVGCLLFHVSVWGQSFIVDPASIHIEETASNWQTAILTGLVLSGNYGFAYYRIDFPPIEAGLPKQIGTGEEADWIHSRRAQRIIGWAADRAAYHCAQRFIANRSYYVNRARVLADFKQAMELMLKTKASGARVRYEGPNTPRIDRSEIRFLSVSFGAYLAHLGVGE